MKFTTLGTFKTYPKSNESNLWSTCYKIDVCQSMAFCTFTKF